MTISLEDFLKIDIRVGTIIRAEPYPESHNPSTKLWINFGEPIGERKTSAQITTNYNTKELIGRQIAAVTNFPPRQIGKFMSEVLVLGFPDENQEVILIQPEKSVPNGGRLY